MSTDPQRLLDPGGDATDAERDLLRTADEVEPAPDAHAATWAALATRLPPIGGSGAPPGPPGGAGTGGGAAPGATGSIVGARVLGLAAVGSVLVIGAWIVLRGQPPTSPSGTVAAPPSITMARPPPETPPALAGADNPTPEPPTAPSPSPLSASTGSAKPRLPHAAAPLATASAGSATSAVDALREESALVAAARLAMRRGDGAAALDSLEIARARFPRGTLLQEREVLTIEALAQNGNASAASRRASAFLKAFPASPHVAHVRTFVQ